LVTSRRNEWCSSFFEGQAPEGCIAIRAILGGWRRRDVLQWSDQAVVDAVSREMARTVGATALPTFHWVHRWDRAIPQYHVGHLKRIEAVDALVRRRRGLYLTGNAYRGVAVNDCTREADRIAELLVDEFESKSPSM
jgi:oxygen-dependent protoporphyrinogen oxidase